MAITAHGAERRDALLTTTIRIIASRGIDRTRLQDVAEASSVSIGTVQHYFGTREQLVDEALGVYTLQTVRLIWQAVPDQAQPWAQLVALVRAYRRAGDIKERSRIWISLSNSAMTNDAHRRLLESLYFQWAQPFLTVLRRGVDADVFAPIMPIEACTDTLLRLTDGFAMAEATTLDGALALAAGGRRTTGSTDDLTEQLLLKVCEALVRPSASAGS